MKKCRHRKGEILASTSMVRFIPDQEPFEAGVVENCGFEDIVAESVNIHYCPKCNEIQDIEVDGDVWAHIT